MRWSTAGESHGQSLIALLEGMPAGVEISERDIKNALYRRRVGYGRGSRQKFENDEIKILSGLIQGKSIGSPIAIEIANPEWEKWKTVMNPQPTASALELENGRGDERELPRGKPLTCPRPGHADLAGMNKYGFTDIRPVLERASARETAARVVLGSLAASFLEQAAGIKITSQIVRVGKVAAENYRTATAADIPTLDASPVRTLDANTEALFCAEIDKAQKSGDTVGGIAEITAEGVPIGLGTYAVPANRLDAKVAAAMMSIPAVKGVEIGAGFAAAAQYGTNAHDEIIKEADYLERLSNNAGGIEGGISNGAALVVRIAFKPISTVPRALRTIDISTGAEATAIHQRSDTTAIVPGSIIGEAMLALVLAEAMVEKFGGDSLAEVRRNLASFQAAIPPERK